MSIRFWSIRTLVTMLALVLITGFTVSMAEDKMSDSMKKCDELMKKCDDMTAKCDAMMSMKGDKPMSGMPMMMCHACDECSACVHDILTECAEHVEKDPRTTKAHIEKAIALLDKCAAAHKKMGEMMMGSMKMCAHCNVMGTMDKCPACKGDMKLMKDEMMCPGCGMMADKATKCEHCKMDMKPAGEVMKDEMKK